MVRYPLTMLGSSSKTIATSEHQDYETKHPIYLQPLCTHTITLFFTFNTVLNKLNEIVNQPCYKIGCALDDFAQLLAKVSVPIMFKLG